MRAPTATEYSTRVTKANEPYQNLLYFVPDLLFGKEKNSVYSVTGKTVRWFVTDSLKTHSTEVSSQWSKIDIFTWLNTDTIKHSVDVSTKEGLASLHYALGNVKC